MFERTSDIHPYLAEAGLGPFAEEIERLCVPALAFEPAGAGAAAVQLGGAPLMAASGAWPAHPAYRESNALGGRFGGRGPGLARTFSGPTPLHFVASIELAAVKRTGVLGGLLPGAGRLLFFWDPLAGCYVETEESCRVIWDRADASSLARHDVPPALQAQMQGEYIPAVFPQKPLTPLAVWSMPDKWLLQDIGSADLRASLEDGDWEEIWDGFSDAMIDAGAWKLASGREVLPHRLGGWPIPEQGDPRYAAVAAARGALGLTGRMPDEAEKAACEAEMHRWTLLLQIDLNKLSDVFAEGTVYFVMREADLKAQNFDRVHAIYQQT